MGYLSTAKPRAAAPPSAVEINVEHDKGHGRIESRTTSLVHEVDWLSGERRSSGELRLPGVACIIRAQARIHAALQSRIEIIRDGRTP